MNKYLDEADFENLRQKLEARQAKILISKSIARQFFFRVSNQSILETTGESLVFKKSAIWAILGLAMVLMLTTLGSIILDSGWSAAITVPLVGIFWTVVAGLTSHLGSWVHSAVALVAATLIAWFLPASYALPLMELTLSIVLIRFAHELAQRWVTALVSRSFAAYDMMAPHITLEYQDAPE